jgi:hypothetical protein
LFYTAFVKWQNFFKFSGYFGRKGSKKSGNSGLQFEISSSISRRLPEQESNSLVFIVNIGEIHA